MDFYFAPGEEVTTSDRLIPAGVDRGLPEIARIGSDADSGGIATPDNLLFRPARHAKVTVRGISGRLGRLLGGEGLLRDGDRGHGLGPAGIKARWVIASMSSISLTPLLRAWQRWKRSWSASPPATRAATVIRLRSRTASSWRPDVFEQDVVGELGKFGGDITAPGSAGMRALVLSVRRWRLASCATYCGRPTDSRFGEEFAFPRNPASGHVG